MDKAWYASKTIWVGILEIVIGALGLAATFLQAGDYTPAAFALLAVGVLTVVLRFLTSQPIG